MLKASTIMLLTGIIILIIILIYLFISVRSFARKTFGTANLSKIIEQQDTLEQTTPRSLSGMDAIFLPRILEDFPDFDVALAKTTVKHKIFEMFKDKAELRVHGIVIRFYTRSSLEKSILFQSAFQYRENGRLCQKRYLLQYSFILDDSSGDTIAANCPNCGGAITDTNQQNCEFCGCRVANVLGNTWEFTDIHEC